MVITMEKAKASMAMKAMEIMKPKAMAKKHMAKKITLLSQKRRTGELNLV